MAERKPTPIWVRSFHPADTERNLDMLANMVEVLLPDYPSIKVDVEKTASCQVGQSLTLTVQLNSNEKGTITKQWQKYDQTNGWEDVASETDLTLVFGTYADTDKGSYKLVITNTFNGTTATTISGVCVVTTDPGGE